MTRLAALIMIGAAVVLLAFFWLLKRKNPYAGLRTLAPFKPLEKARLQAIEDGSRMVIMLGNSLLSQEVSISGMGGMPILKKLADQAVLGDHAPIAMSGEGSLACLSQMILAGAYRDGLAPELFSNDQSQFAGASPFAYLAACLAEGFDDNNSALVLAGHFRPEMVLLADLAGREGLFCLADSDAPGAQALFYASTMHTLIGEEFYAGGANLRIHPLQAASLRTQDVLRILIAVTLIVGVALKLMGII